VLLALAFGVGLVAQESKMPSSTDEIIHVLNRTSFGIRPGDVEAVQKMGLETYLQQQLHPETIDDSATEAAVAQLSMMGLPTAEICRLDNLYNTQRAVRMKLAALYEAEASGQKLAANNSAPGMNPAGDNMMAPTMGEGEMKAPASTKEAPASAAPAMEGGMMAPTSAAATPSMEGGMMAAPSTAGGNPLLTPSYGTYAAMSPEFLQQLAAAPTPQAKVDLLMHNEQGTLPKDPLERNKELLRRATVFTPNLPPQQLAQAKLVRAVDSKRQLQEVLVDFWNNHFNVDARKDNVRLYMVNYDRDVIRPHILGNFRDLLEATTKSPAMLLYLDNASNVVNNTVPKNAAQAAQMKRLGGLNENYGREIMELHTLGVDAGYTQKDVQEVARCFTGWTLDRRTGDFVFKPNLHDNGPKTVLGHAIPANGGMQDGETVLDILTSSPKCAHFIAKEMCERFVSDDPPEALVKRIATVFTETKGDLRRVTEAILTSPEFLSPSTFGNKVKSPEEFVISAVRASGSTITPDMNANLTAAIAAATPAPAAMAMTPADRMKHVSRPAHGLLRGAIAQMGEPLYNCSPPTGYKEVSWVWVNPGALISRLNFAIVLTGAGFTDVKFDAQKILGDDIDVDKPDAVVDRCVSVLLQNKISDSTRKVLTETTVPAPGASGTINPSKLIALILGSPEFQRK
jgi:uncharacterized protein (DUF1800 family)